MNEHSMYSSHAKLGPNMKMLIIKRMTVLIIPPLERKPLEKAIEAIIENKLAHHWRVASVWALQSVELLRQFDEWKGKSDEELAGMLLDRAEFRQKP